MRTQTQWTIALLLFIAVDGCRSLGPMGGGGGPGIQPGINGGAGGGIGGGAPGPGGVGGGIGGGARPGNPFQNALFKGISGKGGPVSRRSTDHDDGEVNPGPAERRNRSTNDNPGSFSATEQAAWDEALARAVTAAGGQSANVLADPEVCAEAAWPRVRDMAANEERVTMESHDGSGERIGMLTQGKVSGGEIIAMNSASSPTEAAEGCARQWKESPGHNVHMMPEQALACYSMVRSPRGNFYCIGIVANKPGQTGGGYAQRQSSGGFFRRLWN